MSTTRLLDANHNRAREALRTLEDAARFLLNDAALAGEAKAVRHALSECLRDRLRGAAAHRDTPGDVGTSIRTEAEMRRCSGHDVAAAAGARLGEALRCLEEFGKIDSGAVAPGVDAAAIERLRYRAYELERRLLLRLPGRERPQWRLCLLLTESLCRLPWREVLRAALDAGVDCVQVREKHLDGGALRARAEAVLAAAAGRAAVVVNDRVDVALAAGADGVHLGQSDLSALDARRLAGPDLIVGVSTSRLAEAEAAAAAGADYCGVGPMFPTTTKQKDDIVGPAYLREYLSWGGLPHLAIGGITAERLGPLVEAGAQGVAVTAAICAAADPGAAAHALLGGLASHAG